LLLSTKCSLKYVTICCLPNYLFPPANTFLANMDNRDSNSVKKTEDAEMSSQKVTTFVDPKTFPTWRKWILLSIVGLCAFNV
jgi:hypothetical protein